MSRQIRPLCDFPYSPLEYGCHQIRLIQLRPDGPGPRTRKRSRPLSAYLVHATPGKCQPYIALSYAWGRSNIQVPLRLGGQLYHISETVDAALRQLRDSDSDIFVWVDQICINQHDDTEKERQVRQMKEIYSEAETVVAWLGPSENSSDKLLRHLGRMGTFISAANYLGVFAAHQNEQALRDVQQAFRFLCERDYWKRLWILQEYAVASHLRIACGDVTIWEWQIEAVLVFTNELDMNAFRLSPEGRDVEKLSRDVVSVYRVPQASFMEGVVTRRSRYQRTGGDGDSLFRVLVTALVLERDYNYPLASDPRDRIFSILQLVDDKDQFAAFPNYTWTCERVFFEAALTMLRQGHIDILAYSQPQGDSTNVPSWVPDWRRHIRSPCADPPWENSSSASGNTLSQQTVLSPRPGVVVLKGILVDAVDECCDAWDPDWLRPLDYPGAAAYLEQTRALCQKSSTFSCKTDAEVATACLSTARCKTIADDEFTQSPADHYSDVLVHLRHPTAPAQTAEGPGSTREGASLKIVDSTVEDNWVNWYVYQLKYLHSRRPFMSKTGLVGTVPLAAQSGDLLCIFLGGKVPYVIRPTREGQGAYTLIGEAFAFGIMDGEYLESNYEAEPVLLR